MDELVQYLPFIIPYAVINYTLVIIALVDLVRRKKVRFNNKYIWGAIIILIQMFGPIAYFIARGEDEE